MSSLFFNYFWIYLCWQRFRFLQEGQIRLNLLSVIKGRSHPKQMFSIVFGAEFLCHGTTKPFFILIANKPAIGILINDFKRKKSNDFLSFKPNY